MIFHIRCFDRIILRGYIMGLFMEGSIIHLLRNLGFTKHSNGVLKSLSDQFNSHIKKVSNNCLVLKYGYRLNIKFILHF